jgi:hypothetical protein
VKTGEKTFFYLPHHRFFKDQNIGSELEVNDYSCNIPEVTYALNQLIGGY